MLRVVGTSSSAGVRRRGCRDSNNSRVQWAGTVQERVVQLSAPANAAIALACMCARVATGTLRQEVQRGTQ